MKKLTPVQTENFMTELRKVREFSEKQEWERIVSELEKTSQNVKKVQMEVNPLVFHIPSWQRDLRMEQVNTICQKYSDLLFENIKAVVHEDKLYVVEGQHRVVGTALREMRNVTVEILKCSMDEAKEIFKVQGVVRNNPTPADIWRVNIDSKEETYIKVKKMCDKYKFAISYDDKKPENCVGTLRTVTDYTGGLKCEPRISLELLGRTLSLLKNLGWCASDKLKIVPTSLLRPLAALYTHTEKCMWDEMEKVMIKNLKGVQNFETKILPMKWKYYFDSMVEIINENNEFMIVDKNTVHNQAA